MLVSASTPLLPTGEQFEISADTDFGRAVVTITEVAAALRAFTVDELDIVQRYPLDAPPSLGAGIVMAPWPNRIDSGKWNYGGQKQQLAITDTEFYNASHGLLTATPYAVASRTDSSITLTATIFAQAGYPFVIETAVTYSLTANGLETTHTLINRGSQPAPVAVGSHAYYKIGDVATSDLILSNSAKTVYTNDARLLPNGSVDVFGDFDLREGRRVGDVTLDDCFTNQNVVDGRHRCRLTAPDGRFVEVWTDESFSHTVLLTTRRFTDENGDAILAVAIEPQTAAVNSLNNGIGFTWLEPGETWSVRWGVSANL